MHTDHRIFLYIGCDNATFKIPPLPPMLALCNVLSGHFWLPLNVKIDFLLNLLRAKQKNVLCLDFYLKLFLHPLSWLMSKGHKVPLGFKWLTNLDWPKKKKKKDIERKNISEEINWKHTFVCGSVADSKQTQFNNIYTLNFIITIIIMTHRFYLKTWELFYVKPIRTMLDWYCNQFLINKLFFLLVYSVRLWEGEWHLLPF